MTTLPIMEHFYTLQGEGAYAGCAAYFIRLAGCDVGCHWCDVKESWTVSDSQYHSVEEIVSWVQNTAAKIAVITGGEPSMYELSTLTERLQSLGIRTHIETAAPHLLTGNWDWVTLSPKKFKPPMAENYALAHELKVIIFNKTDFEWAEKEAAKCPAHTRLFLQVEWEKREKLSPLIVEYIQQNPQWQLSVQTHKYLQIP